jgi:hypothetical protein
MFSSKVYGDPKTPVLQAYQGDPTRIHVVAAPGSEQMHVFSMNGASFPLDPNLNATTLNNPKLGSVKLQNRSLGAYETLDAYLDGGMGGAGQVKGDFVYQDRRLVYTEDGMWGLLRSLDKTVCTNLQALPGFSCGAPAPAPAPTPAPSPAPAAVAPSVPGTPAQKGFVAPSAMGTNANLALWTAPLTVSWPASTGTVDHYEVQASSSSSSNLLTWTAPTAYSTVATSPSATATVKLAVGKMNTTGITLNKYTFQVRACATADSSLCSAFSTVSQPFTMIPVDDIIVGPLLSGAGSIGYSGSWLTKALSGAYGGTVHYTTATGANALLQNVTFTVSGDVAWVSTMGPNMGIATVSVDGGPAQTVDLYSPTVKTATVVWQTAGLAPGITHTVRVTDTGTKNASSLGTELDIDTFLAVR